MAANWALSMSVSCISKWFYWMMHKNLSPVKATNLLAASVIHWFTQGIFTDFLPYAKHCNLKPWKKRSSDNLKCSIMSVPFPFSKLSSWASRARIEYHLFSRLRLLIQTWAQASSSEKPFPTILYKIASWVWSKHAHAQSINLFHFLVTYHSLKSPCLFISLLVRWLSNLKRR